MTRARAIGVAQTIPVRGDVDANVERHVRLVHVAAEERARLVLFPELSLTGYELDLADELAFSLDDTRLTPLVESASSSGTTVIVGAPVRVRARLHIGAFIISPDRKVTLYTKQRLGTFPAGACRDGVVPVTERAVFQPGRRNPRVRFDGHVAAVAVCADTGRPAHPRAAARRGATTYLASMFIIPSDHEHTTTNLTAYAREFSMVVACANFGGPSGGLAAAGQSAIWSPTGKRLVRLDAVGAGVAVAIEGDAGWTATARMLADR